MWCDKYAKDWDICDLIQFSEDKSRSHIYRMAWEGHSLFENHSFWETRRNGKMTKIWEYYWKQLLPLGKEGVCPMI